MLRWERNPSAVSLKIPSDSAVWVSDCGEDGCLDLKYAVMKFVELCGFVLLVLYMSFVALMHHFLGVWLCLAINWKSVYMRSWAVSGRNFMISLGRVSGPGAFPVEALWHAIV